MIFVLLRLIIIKNYLSIILYIMLLRFSLQYLLYYNFSKHIKTIQLY